MALNIVIGSNNLPAPQSKSSFVLGISGTIAGNDPYLIVFSTADAH